MNDQEVIELYEILKDLQDKVYKPKRDDIKKALEIYEPFYERMKKRMVYDKVSYLDFFPHKECDKAIQTLSNSKALYREAENNLKKYDRETQDILHALELLELEDEEVIKLMNELKELRKKRRLAKNFFRNIETFKRCC